MQIENTIVAPITAHGKSAVAVIRLSGDNAVSITQNLLQYGLLQERASHTVQKATLYDGKKIIDEVLITIFKAPQSFTGEDVVEISCHGSSLIVNQIVQALCNHGASLATPGAFTQRAFLNKKMDLTQAEAIADLIVAETEGAKQLAVQHMRGGFTKIIETLRQNLIHFTSLIELELDFSEENVEFAQREELKKLVSSIQSQLYHLINSFQEGNVIKNGVPVVIAGQPNVGKSTLLNALLNDNKAIVSAFPGTTRDLIEGEVIWQGIRFRFVDTAGLRTTTDQIEALGIARAHEAIRKASLILYVCDASTTTPNGIEKEIATIAHHRIPHIVIANKIDIAPPTAKEQFKKTSEAILISAQKNKHVENLKQRIIQLFQNHTLQHGDVLITNMRHYQCLQQTYDALERVLKGIAQNQSSDLIAVDIRHALQHLGEITGAITTDDLLANIFSKFCIGK